MCAIVQSTIQSAKCLHGEMAQIKAEIERLEKALRDCTDSGIRGVIQDWIADAQRGWRPAKVHYPQFGDGSLQRRTSRKPEPRRTQVPRRSSSMAFLGYLSALVWVFSRPATSNSSVERPAQPYIIQRLPVPGKQSSLCVSFLYLRSCPDEGSHRVEVSANPTSAACARTREFFGYWSRRTISSSCAGTMAVVATAWALRRRQEASRLAVET